MSYKKDYLIVINVFDSPELPFSEILMGQNLIRIGRKKKKYVNAFVDGLKSILPISSKIYIETYN